MGLGFRRTVIKTAIALAFDLVVILPDKMSQLKRAHYQEGVIKRGAKEQLTQERGDVLKKKFPLIFRFRYRRGCFGRDKSK